MKIAIIGAGFCGLAVALELLKARKEITVFDSRKIGAGTSGIAAGLLHPYAGAHAKLNWKGHEGVDATLKSLSIAANALGQPVFSQDQGIIRLAISEKQQSDYLKSPACQDPNALWIDAEKCQSMVPGSIHAPGLWIKNGVTVYPQFYLNGLWMACEKLGGQFCQQRIKSLKELDDFQLCIITAGAESLLLPELCTIPLRTVKGQILELEWPSSVPPLCCALNSQVYIIMSPDKKSCLVGSTYEKKFIDDQVDIEVAKSGILPKAIEILPFLDKAKIVGAYAGLRAVAPNHLPLIKQLDSRTWILTGMGSKGLLYHALMAQELVQSLDVALG